MGRSSKKEIIRVMFLSGAALAAAMLLVSCANPLTMVSTPFFSPSAGTFDRDQLITLTCVTAGATIYYTTDGSTPTTSSTMCGAPISVTGSGAVTIQANAALSGRETSTAGFAAYTIRCPPSASYLPTAILVG